MICCGVKLKKEHWKLYLYTETLRKLFQFISIHLLATSSYQKRFKLSVLFIIMMSLSCFKAEAVIGVLQK